MHSADERSDEALLGTRGGDAAADAFAVFYARHERAVLVYFMRRVRDAELAADLAAETFAQALACRRRFRPRRHRSAVAWLFGIAQHVLGRSVRRARVEDRYRQRLGIAPLSFEDDELATIERLGSDAAAIEALERLPAIQREAVRAHVLAEDSYEEIAARLQCSNSVVRKRVSRGLASLRQELEEPT